MSETITKNIRRKLDLEATLLELGCDVSALAGMTKMARVNHLRTYVHDLRMAVDAEKLLFPQEMQP